MFADVLWNKVQPPGCAPPAAAAAGGGAAEVRSVEASDEAQAVATIMMGFSTDPVARWAYPDADQYLTHFPRFIRAFAGKSFAHKSAYYTGNFTGAALWLPPGVDPDEDALSALVRETVAEHLQEDLFEMIEQMGAYHPGEPHWYLPMIGVDTYRQNRGGGTALMRHALERCDRDRLPAYLESSNPRNISLYQRFGFVMVGTIQAGSSPPMFPMVRKPQV